MSASSFSDAPSLGIAWAESGVLGEPQEGAGTTNKSVEMAGDATKGEEEGKAASKWHQKSS